MFSKFKTVNNAGLLIAPLLLLFADGAKGTPVSLGFTQTSQGTLFRYNFSVTDNVPSGDTLLSVTLSVPAQAAAVQNLMAPVGFSAFFDSGLGLIDFVADTKSFTPSITLSGFMFSSPFPLANPAFSALALDSAENPVTFTGAAAAAVPEPASVEMFAGAFLLLVSGHLFIRTRESSAIK